MKSSQWRTAARRLLLPVTAAVLALLGTQCLLLPDDNFSGQPTGNSRPTARITGGVLENGVDIAENRVHFYWYGADRDGVIRWFEWAVDDTISESAWTRTTAFDEVIFTLATNLKEGGNYSDWHTFYVRSVDDQYMRSRPDIRLFNAHTIAPTSEIAEPEPVDGARWAATLRMTWLGEDLDSGSADRVPAYFEIKHVEDPGVDVTRPALVEQLFETAPNLLLAPNREDYPDDSLYFEQASRAWKRVPGAVTEQWLEGMRIGLRYGFCVRAIDEAGAAEQGVFTNAGRNKNWVMFQVRPALIEVVTYESSMGSHRFDSAVFGDPWEVTVAPGQRFRFQWVADASASGTEAGPCNYGFDIPDPEDNAEPFRATDGMGGWIGWAPRLQMQDVVSFSQEGAKVHYFYLKIRDISNNKDTETRCIVRITVAQFGFSKKFLVVDDQRRRPASPWANSPDPYKALPVSDEFEDAWRTQVLQSMSDFLPAGEQPGIHNIFPDEGTSPAIDIPDNFLDTMGEYQTIIWDCAGGDDIGFELAANSNLLSRYVGAGGNMLIFNWVGPVTKVTGEFSERAQAPKEPEPDDLSDTQSWNRFGFLWQHLHLRGAVDKPRGEDRARDRQSIIRAVSADPAYPDIPLDYTRWGRDPRDLNNRRGDHYFECLVPNPDETGLTPWYEREEGLEPIYTARCYTDINHNLNDKPVAWRTFVTQEDLLAGLRRGRIICYAFHPYYFDMTATETAVSLSLMWLAGGSN